MLAGSRYTTHAAGSVIFLSLGLGIPSPAAEQAAMIPRRPLLHSTAALSLGCTVGVLCPVVIIWELLGAWTP